MSRFVLRPSLILLRILIVAGALSSVVQPQQPRDRVNLALVNFDQFNCDDQATSAVSSNSRALIRLALTALTISLL